MMELQTGEKLDSGPHGFLHSQVSSLQLSKVDPISWTGLGRY